ncbi:MAG: hypothetical protein H3Z50_01240 [archaeon]|nr:hypothetical protein [archaeon]
MNSKIVEDPSLRYRRYVFKDRIHAGELLAEKLRRYKTEDAFVLANPLAGFQWDSSSPENSTNPLTL